MVNFSKPVTIKKIYSSDWEMPDKNNPGQKISGTSFKMEIEDSTDRINPLLKVSPECFKLFGFDDPLKVAEYTNRQWALEVACIAKSSGNGIINDIFVVDIQPILKK